MIIYHNNVVCYILVLKHIPVKINFFLQNTNKRFYFLFKFLLIFLLLKLILRTISNTIKSEIWNKYFRILQDAKLELVKSLTHISLFMSHYQLSQWPWQSCGWRMSEDCDALLFSSVVNYWYVTLNSIKSDTL